MARGKHRRPKARHPKRQMSSLTLGGHSIAKGFSRVLVLVAVLLGLVAVSISLRGVQIRVEMEP